MEGRGAEMCVIRKFRKSDTRQVARVIFDTFKEFNGREYFEKKTIRRYLDQYDVKQRTTRQLCEEFRRSRIFFVAVEEAGSWD
jgi:ribosomal protein S10